MNANQFLGMVGITCGTVITLFTMFQRMPMAAQLTAGGVTAGIATAAVVKGAANKN
jgi:hypothetical protein